MSTRRLSVSNSLHSLNNSRRSSLASFNGSEEPLELRRIGTDDELFSRTKRGTLRRSTLDCSGLRNQSWHSLPETSTTNRRSTMDMTMGLRKIKEDDEKKGRNIENRTTGSLVNRSITTNVRVLPSELDMCNMKEKQMSLRSLEDRQVEEQSHEEEKTTKIRDLDSTLHSIEQKYSLNIDEPTLHSLIKDVEQRMKRKSLQYRSDSVNNSAAN